MGDALKRACNLEISSILFDSTIPFTLDGVQFFIENNPLFPIDRRDHSIIHLKGFLEQAKKIDRTCLCIIHDKTTDDAFIGAFSMKNLEYINMHAKTLFVSYMSLEKSNHTHIVKNEVLKLYYYGLPFNNEFFMFTVNESNRPIYIIKEEEFNFFKPLK